MRDHTRPAGPTSDRAETDHLLHAAAERLRVLKKEQEELRMAQKDTWATRGPHAGHRREAAPREKSREKTPREKSRDKSPPVLTGHAIGGPAYPYEKAQLPLRAFSPSASGTAIEFIASQKSPRQGPAIEFVTTQKSPRAAVGLEYVPAQRSPRTAASGTGHLSQRSSSPKASPRSSVPVMAPAVDKAVRERQRRALVDVFLREHGYASVDTPKRTMTMRTKYPLHTAAKQGDPMMVEMLLEEGADPLQRDSKGLTPAQVAHTSDKRHSHAAVLRILETSRGPNRNNVDDTRVSIQTGYSGYASQGSN